MTSDDGYVYQFNNDNSITNLVYVNLLYNYPFLIFFHFCCVFLKMFQNFHIRVFRVKLHSFVASFLIILYFSP